MVVVGDTGAVLRRVRTEYGATGCARSLAGATRTQINGGAEMDVTAVGVPAQFGVRALDRAAEQVLKAVQRVGVVGGGPLSGVVDFVGAEMDLERAAGGCRVLLASDVLLSGRLFARFSPVRVGAVRSA
jgi:hypothetical protein